MILEFVPLFQYETEVSLRIKRFADRGPRNDRRWNRSEGSSATRLTLSRRLPFAVRLVVVDMRLTHGRRLTQGVDADDTGESPLCRYTSQLRYITA